MARLAQNWVETNYSSVLSPISTLEKSFSNGYNFLKILEAKRIVTEEDMRDARDGNTPNIVLKNMNILSKGLKSINIQISKQQIADIISEQPGGAADLILSLKKNFENLSTVPKWRNDAYKNSIKSLHPKTIRKLEGEDEHETRFFSTMIGKGANFREVDSFAQQKRFYDFDHDEEQRYKERLEKEHHTSLNRLAEKRQQFLDTLDRRIQHRLDTTSVGKKNWRANELDKKKRLTRHLQYELTVAEQRKEKKDWENTVHREEQQAGIEDYENNLKRNGLGGDDSTGGEVLLPSTESSEMYLNRIEEKVQTQWPTNSEVSDFMQNLEKRTRELRLARQEKARRKRRLQVEQKAALLEIGGSSAPPSRSNSVDVSSLVGLETPEQKAARKSAEAEELTQRSAVQRSLQAKEGEKQVRIFAERRRMMAYENEDWKRKKEAVLAAQAVRAQEKRIRSQALCQAMVLELITDLFPSDASSLLPPAPAATGTAATGTAATATGDDIFHTNLLKDLKELAAADQPTELAATAIPIFSRVSRSNAMDLYPSVALLASNIARWRQVPAAEGEGSGGYHRVNSFRESALEIFQQVQRYSESTSITPFTLDASSEYLPLLTALTSRSAEAKISPPQSVFLLAGGAHDLPQEILGMACDWLGGSEMICLITLPTAVEIGLKLRASVVAGDDSATADPSLVRFEHLYDLWGLESTVDRSLFPEISFHASRIVSDVFDVLSRISSGTPLLETSATTTSLELSSFKFSDTTLAILLAQILWLREYVSSAVSALKDPTASAPAAPLTPIVLASFSFGSPDRVATLRVFDWFLRGGSRTNLPEGDEELAREITEEIATVPLEKGKKATKPAGGKGKKDKRDPTELLKPSSPIAGVVWLQQQATSSGGTADEALPTSGSLLVDVTRRYAALLKQKFCANPPQLEGVKAAAESFAESLNTPLLWLGDGSPADLAHPFNAIEGLIATVLVSLPTLALPPPPSEQEQEQQSSEPAPEPKNLSQEIFDVLQHRRQVMLSTPQRIWLNHTMGTNPIALDAFRLSLDGIREGMAQEADGFGGIVLSVLLRIQQIRSEMLCERARMCHSLKLTEGQWRVTCLEWRDQLLEAENLFKRQSLQPQSPAIIATFLQTKSRELECELGDLIDLRHQRWTQQLDQLSHRLASLLEILCETIFEIVAALQRSFPARLQRSLADSLQLTALLEEAKYLQFPWSLRSETKGDGMSRVESNRLKDEVRTQVGLLFSEVNEVLQMTKEATVRVSNEETTTLAREMVTGIEGLSSPSSSPLMAAVATEIKTEGYEMLATLLRALLESLMSLREVSRGILSELKDFSFKRNQYEHRLLREWISELRQSFAPAPAPGSSPYASAISFMSSFYYGVSDDPEHDGVPRSSLSHHGLVDVGEMALPLRKIRLLSSEMLIERSLSCSLPSPSAADAPFDPFRFLTAAIQRLFDRSETLPLVWRQIPKLRSLIQSICEARPSAAQSSEQFSVELILRLLYGVLPLSAPSSFTLKLGRKICEETMTTLSPHAPCAVELSTVLSLLDKDKGLGAGWWPPQQLQAGQALQDHRDLVRLVLEAIALTCAIPETAKLRSHASGSGGEQPSVESVDINLDRLLLALCYGPSLANETVTALQSALCLSCDSLSSPLPPPGSSRALPPAPQFLYESMTKLLLVGCQLIRSEEPANTPTPPLGGAQSLYRSVFGPALPSCAPLTWLASLSGLDGPLLDRCLPASSPEQPPLLCRDILDTLRRLQDPDLR